MSDLERFRSPGNQQSDIPAEWKPRLEVDDVDGGYVVSRPSEQPHSDYGNVLAEFGLDPEAWHVRSVRRSRWQTYDERWLESVRLQIVPSGTVSGPDYDLLAAQIAAWKPRTSPKTASVSGTFVVPVGDTQIGKVDGEGTPATIGRTLTELERAAQTLRAAVPKGRAPHVCLPWLGDCIEGIWSQGGSLRARLDLTLTEQVRVVRRLMWAQLRLFANLADHITVPVVPGNHDEAVRTAGSMSSTYDDSWAVEAASAVADMVAENDDLAGRVRFIFPAHDELTVVADCSGTTVAMAHGHQFGSGKDAALTWWDQQAGGRTPAGMSDLLLSAHFHHLRVVDHGGEKLWIQIPALDSGSTWFRHRKGQSSPPRIVPFWTADGRVWGLDPLQVAS